MDNKASGTQNMELNARETGNIYPEPADHKTFKNDDNIESSTGEEDTSSGEEEDSDSSEEEEEEEITYHKPVFLKKSAVQQRTTSVSTPKKTDEERSEQRIQHSLNVSRNISITKTSIEESYTSTDKDLLKRTLLLDDNDTIDPDLEYSKWETRQEARLKRERQILLQRQLESEEKQERALKRSLPIEEHNNNDLSTGTVTTPLKKGHKPPSKLKTTNYKPQRLNTTTFTSNLPSATTIERDNNDNNEYSAL